MQTEKQLRGALEIETDELLVDAERRAEGKDPVDRMIFRTLDFADQAQADLLGNDRFRKNRTGATQFFKDELLGVSMEDFKRSFGVRNDGPVGPGVSQDLKNSLLNQGEKEMELQREQIRQQQETNRHLGRLPAVQGL
jgi:hypothetical protein